MEKALNEMEKIKKAEEIAYRRQYPNEKFENVDKEKKTYFGSKILLEGLILINITIIVFCVQNKDEIFSENFLQRIASYQIDIKQNLDNFVNSIINVPEDATIFENNNSTENVTNTNTENISEAKTIENNLEEQVAIGGGNEVEETKEEIIENNENDSEKVKNNYDLTRPISGTVTSRFGTRESTNKKINGYHTGTDIAVNSGTEILAANSGEVILVSSEGDYGKHLKIQDGDLITLYAHCSKILVKEGQKVNKGEKIALVGSTGNSTGPHLHFEVRYQNRYVNPQEIFEF